MLKQMAIKNTSIITFLLVTFCVLSIMNARELAKFPKNSIFEINSNSKEYINASHFEYYILNQQYTHTLSPIIPGLPTSPLPSSSKEIDIPSINSSFSIHDRDVEYEWQVASG